MYNQNYKRYEQIIKYQIFIFFKNLKQTCTLLRITFMKEVESFERTGIKPLSEPLAEEEMLKLKQKILQKSRPKRKTHRLILVLAAAMCLLVACGAVAIGLFDSMSDTNQTTEMVEKYSLALENPPSTTVDGHTVTVQAIICSDNIARVIYDITGSEKQLNDWTRFYDSEDRAILRIQMFTNGQPSGHTDVVPDHDNQIRQSSSIGKVPKNNSFRFFADLSLTDGTDTVSVYVLSEDNSAEVLQAELLEPIEEKELSFSDAALTATAEGVKIHCLIQKIRIGKDGSFFSASGHTGDKDFSAELGSYDLLDPEEVAKIEIGGVKYPIE